MLKMRLELLGDFEVLASLLRSVGRPARSRGCKSLATKKCDPHLEASNDQPAALNDSTPYGEAVQSKQERAAMS